MTALVILASLTLAGCARDCAGCNRTMTGKRNYEVVQYSGGEEIGRYRFFGILNNQEGSDGYYWSVGDTLYEVSGDVFVRSWRGGKRIDK